MSYIKIEIEHLQKICESRLKDISKFKGTLDTDCKRNIEDTCNRLLCMCELADQRIVELSKNDSYLISYNLKLM